MNSELAAVIVHDIKNALGVLEGKLQQLTLEPSREDAVRAHDTCIALRERLIAFLTLYKASSQGLHARVEALNPEDFLRGLIRSHASARPELRISLELSQAPALGFFDENLVTLALEAALQNAGRFARSEIEIGCAGQPGAPVQFSIRDDGPGLGAKESVPSTGLGTALCAAIAQAHHKDGVRGTVSLQNDPRGGALFILQLP